MDITQSQDPVACFTLELLRGGLMLSGVVSDLVEALKPEDDAGEEPGAVVMEMITGTIATALGATDGETILQATALIGDACDRVLEHLRLALELCKRSGGEG
jgi:hypothetical protein